jgi:lysophospholipase L1-like esterase
MFQKIGNIIRYVVTVTLVALGFLVLVELVAFLLVPQRYQDPPAVTADAWIHSDALARPDTVWMKGFVDEFCRSYHARWTPYLYFRRLPFEGRYINIDSSGIRYTPQFTQRPPPLITPEKIFLFGGSTMWGTGAADSGTIPSQLSRILATDSLMRYASVTNFGESGYVSTQSLLRLELELRKGNVPDQVILYDGVNDVYAAYQDGEAGAPQNEVNRLQEFNLLKENSRMMSLGIEAILGRTMIAEVINGIHRAMKVTPVADIPGEELVRNIVRLYRGNIRILDALSREYGFRYAAYWQPVVFSRKNPTPYEREQSDKLRDVRPLFLDVYHRIAEDSLLNANASFHDISDLFDGVSAPVYLDFCHVTEHGNSMIAARMVSDVGGVGPPAGLSRPPSVPVQPHVADR